MDILLVEDEIELSKALCVILKSKGYNVFTAYDGKRASEMIDKFHYDCILLDIMLPEKDGFEVLKDMRDSGNETPVIAITAKAQTQDKVLGLDLGADDYLVKPFETEELLARLRVQTRRTKKEELCFGELTLDKTTYCLCCGNERILLSNTEFEVMSLLIRSKNEIVSTEKFMKEIWGEDTDTEINVVWVYLSQLRKKIAKLTDNVVLKANRGRGYILVKKDA